MGRNYGGNPAWKKLKAADRRDMALELAIAGLNYNQIGDKLGCSRQRAFQIVHEELARLAEQTRGKTEIYRRRQLERLDTMLKGVWDQATAGDLQAIDRVAKLLDREAKLLGLDKPAQHSFTDSEGATLQPTVIEIVTACVSK